MTKEAFDLVVIGAGPGGYVAAIRGAQLGLRVAIIERENLGGICLNWGCIPTKSILRSSELYLLMRRAGEFGLRVGDIGFDLDAIVERSRTVAGQLSRGVSHLLKKNQVTVFFGAGTIAGPGSVRVRGEGTDELIETRNIIVSTGARARELPGMEADGDRIWTYRHALRPSRMPERLLVIGSGAIGIEFASFYSTLGAETTVVEAVDRMLPVEDAEISGLAKKQFTAQGMTIMEKSQVRRLERRAGSVVAHIDVNGKEVSAEFDTVISAVGIVANSEGIGLEDSGVQTERGHIVTDPFCRTGVEGIFAIGDVTAPPWLAHKASHEGIVAAETAAGLMSHPVDRAGIAGCTYCHPQIASVGMTEEQARTAGREIRVGRFPFLANGKAIALGETEGLVKTVFDANSGELLGAHMIGTEVTELIQGFVIGKQLETTEEELMNAIFPHPTLSEMMHESVLDAFDRVVHF